MFIRKAAKAIIEDINNNPATWNTDCHFSGNHYIIFKGELSIWISNGPSFVGLYRPSSLSIGKINAFNFFEKRAIYKAYKKWLSNKIIESLNK